MQLHSKDRALGAAVRTFAGALYFGGRATA
jgi:hypothetical protein